MDLLAFKVVIEPDEDAWASYYPAWINLGASTWGETREEAAANIKEVLEMLVEEIEEGQIEWPITPYVPNPETSKPSIQDAPEFVQLNCAPEHPDALASHGGLPVSDAGSNVAAGDIYRLMYLAVNNGHWHMAAWPSPAMSRHGAASNPIRISPVVWRVEEGTGMAIPEPVSPHGGNAVWDASGWNSGKPYTIVSHTIDNSD